LLGKRGGVRKNVFIEKFQRNPAIVKGKLRGIQAANLERIPGGKKQFKVRETPSGGGPNDCAKRGGGLSVRVTAFERKLEEKLSQKRIEGPRNLSLKRAGGRACPTYGRRLGGSKDQRDFLETLSA